MDILVNIRVLFIIDISNVVMFIIIYFVGIVDIILFVINFMLV